MPIKRLKKYLDSYGIKYLTISHSMAYTAQEIAASIHISGHQMAKTVIVNVDGNMAMAVLPASHKVNFMVLREIIGTKNIQLATEEEFKYRFPDCEVGAMPPFGNLWDMEVYISEKLALNKEILFNAGSHTEIIRMLYTDFANLVKPHVARYAVASH